MLYSRLRGGPIAVLPEDPHQAAEKFLYFVDILSTEIRTDSS
jgi:hypothetical protein